MINLFLFRLLYLLHMIVIFIFKLISRLNLDLFTELKTLQQKTDKYIL